MCVKGSGCSPLREGVRMLSETGIGMLYRMFGSWLIQQSWDDLDCVVERRVGLELGISTAIDLTFVH